VPQRTWKIKTAKQANGETRAYCGIDGCHQFRQHAEKGTAAQYIMGHMVAQHIKDGVRPDDEFKIK
jgi:hypothetical protein